MASNADKHTKRSVKHCKKCLQPVRGHIGPHGSLCRQPSPQFLEDVPSLANIQEELEASIVQHQQDIANLTAELQLLQIHNSTPVSTANKPQMSSAPVSQVKTSNGPNGSLVFTTVTCGSTLSSNMLGLRNQSAPASFPYAASNTVSTFIGNSGHAQTLPSVGNWTKTIQFQNKKLTVPIPRIPGSILCPVSMLQYYFHQVPHFSSGLIPLFLYQSGLQYHILTYPLFLHLLRQKLSTLGYKPSDYSGHSFRLGGASFAFSLRVPHELIQQQGDWNSDAYLRYLSKPLTQRLRVATAFRSALQHKL